MVHMASEHPRLVPTKATAWRGQGQRWLEEDARLATIRMVGMDKTAAIPERILHMETSTTNLGKIPMTTMASTQTKGSEWALGGARHPEEIPACEAIPAMVVRDDPPLPGVIMATTETITAARIRACASNNRLQTRVGPSDSPLNDSSHKTCPHLPQASRTMGDSISVPDTAAGRVLLYLRPSNRRSSRPRTRDIGRTSRAKDKKDGAGYSRNDKCRI